MADDNPVLLAHRGDGRIALVTLNRPELMNAMNTAMGVRLAEVLEQVAAQARTRVVVITGSGDRAFSSGGDLKERRGMTPEQWIQQHRIFEKALHRLRNLRKPVLAAVNGLAVGGGCEIAMSTDFIIASENARFGLPEVTRGIMPGGGGTQLLPRRLPRGLGMQLLLTGELFGASDALRWGLVNSVHPQAELMEAAIRLATRIAGNSPTAVQQAKRSARLGLDQPVEQAIEIEIECYQRMVAHPDRFEGVNAFNEGRTPAFEDA
jgi:enoyl-CoA hydratase